MSIQNCNNSSRLARRAIAPLAAAAMVACARQALPPTPTTATPVPTSVATCPCQAQAPTPAATATHTPTASATPLPLGYAGRPVTANEQWTPLVRAFEGVEMVLVPVGCFAMGSLIGEDDERPVHEQCFDAPFWMDRLEVTNAQLGSAGAFSGADYPREEISWFDARAHCEGRGARLPTEAEWEYAARGPDSPEYPWGEAFDGHVLNFCDVNCRIEWRIVYNDDGYGTTAPVGSYPGNASWVGALDMSGNVWEWTSSRYDPYPYEAGDGREDPADPERARVMRGSAWDHLPYDARAANRARVAPTFEFHTIGFRCARDL